MTKTNFKYLWLFPCQKNSKIPATKCGFWDADLNFDIDKYSKKGYNIGLACQRSKIIALDCDVDEKRGLNGLKSLEELEIKLGKLPKTLTQSTPRGGRHYFFTDNGIVNPVGKIGSDIDVKYKGYVLIEPSKIDDKSYKFTDGVDKNGNFIIKNLPEEWVKFLNKTIGHKIILTTLGNFERYQRKISDYNFQKMYGGCNFIKYCVDYAEILSEPEWHLFACLLNSLKNGGELFDLYSRPHKDYDPILVKKKFQNAKKYNVNCNTISSVSNCCKNCNHRKGN